MGGLSKKAYQQEIIRHESTLPVLNLDGGSLLFEKATLSAGLQAQAKTTAAGIVSAYNSMTIDAVGVARQDLAAGLPFLEDIAARSRFVWLSANLVRKSSGETVFSPFVIRQLGNIKVGIIGLTDSDSPQNFTSTDDAAIVSWRNVLAPLAERLNKQCDLLILLSNHTLAENRAIAEQVGGIHLIIQAGTDTANMEPQVFNNTLICQTGKQGKHIGVMEIDWQKSRSWGDNRLREKLAGKKREKSGINGRLNRLLRRLPPEELAHHETYQKLLKQKQQVEKETADLESAVERMDKEGKSPSTFDNRFIAMEADLPDQPEILAIVERTKNEVNQLGKRTANTLTSKPFAQDTTEDVGLTGWQTCGSCHDNQTIFWKSTDHARAFQTLVNAGQEFNLSCLLCHVTTDLYSVRPAEPSLLSLVPDLQQVGCESCHGNGQRHANAPGRFSVIRRPPPAICLQCHTEERDHSFNYEQKIKLIACPPAE